MQSSEDQENNENYTEIFTWGADRYGQLGLGNQGGRCYSSPKLCSFSIVIKAVSCGEEHSCLITGDGQIFSVGSNSEGRLGLGDQSMTQSSTPCLVEALSNLNAVHISCGWGHTAAVMDNGELYTWGVGEYGALGIGDIESQWFPVKVTFPNKPSVFIVGVSCGTRHTALIDDKGVLYTCGAGDAGQLGINSRTKQIVPIEVKGIPEPIECVKCGVFHTLTLTKTKKLYTMGGNNLGQLGTGNKRSTITPIKIRELENFNIIKIAAGHHSAALTEGGDLFVWGTGTFGEFLSPTMFGEPGTFQAPLSDISIGGSFGVALDTEGNLYSWGSNTSGELGMGDFESRKLPTLTRGLKGKVVTSVSCGGAYAIALGKTIGVEQASIIKSESIDKSSRFPVDEKNEPFSPLKDQGRDNLLDEIKEKEETKAELEKQIAELEQNIKSNEEETDKANDLNNKIDVIEKQIEMEKQRSNDIIENMREIKQRTIATTSGKSKTNQKIISLKNDIEYYRKENERLRISKKITENSKLGELLKEYEEKIEHEIQEKYRIIKDKQREIDELHDTIPRLKSTINEIELEKTNMEEYYKDEIKKIEDTIADYKKKILQEDNTKIKLQQIYSQNSTRTDNLKREITQAKRKDENLDKEMESCKVDIDQVNYQVLNKQGEIEQIIKKQESLKNAISTKEEEIKTLKEQYTNRENQYMEEINKLRKEINDRTYDNEEIQNKINVKQIELDTLNKDIIAWKQVTNNVANENEALKNIINSLEEKNRRLSNSAKNPPEITQSASKTYSPVKTTVNDNSPVSEVQNKQYNPPEIQRSHGKVLKALEAYTPDDDEDEGHPISQKIRIEDPYSVALLEFQSNSSTESKNINQSNSTQKLIKKLGVESPIRKIVAKEALSPAIETEVIY